MAEYMTLTTTRTTPPDFPALIASLRAQIAPEVGAVFFGPQTVQLKKNTAWTAGERTTAQTLIDTAPAATPQTDAQRLVDNMSIYDKARDLALIDQLNVLRGALRSLGVTGLADITPAQALTAIRNKAGGL